MGEVKCCLEVCVAVYRRAHNVFGEQLLMRKNRHEVQQGFEPGPSEWDTEKKKKEKWNNGTVEQ